MSRELFAQYAHIREQEVRIRTLHESRLQLPQPDELHLRQTNQSLLQAIEAQLAGIGAAREAMENHPDFSSTVTQLLAPVAMAIISYTEDRERYEKAYDQARAVWSDAEEAGLQLPDDLDSHIEEDLMQAHITPPSPVNPIYVLQNAYSSESPGPDTLSEGQQKVLVDLFENSQVLPGIFHQAAGGELPSKTPSAPKAPTDMGDRKPIKEVFGEKGTYTALPHIFEQIAILFINGEPRNSEQIGARLVEKGIVSADQWTMVGNMVFALAQSEISGYFNREQVSTHWETTTKPGQTFYRLVIDHNPHTDSTPPKSPKDSPPTPQPPSSTDHTEPPIEVLNETEEDVIPQLPERVLDSGEWIALETPRIDQEYTALKDTAALAPCAASPVAGQPNEECVSPELDAHEILPTSDQSDLDHSESETPPLLNPIATAVLELMKTGDAFTMGDIRSHLVQNGHITEDEWRARRPSFFLTIQDEIVAHLQTQGIFAEWDHRGNTRAREHFLFISRESSNPNALDGLFPTAKQVESTQDHLHTPRQEMVAIPMPRPASPHNARQLTREDRHAAVQIERQRESERAVVVRDLMRQFEGGCDNRWNAVLRTLQTAHPSIEIEQIMSGLVDSGAYHTVRSNGSKFIYPGPAPESLAAQAPKRGKFEPPSRPDVDFVKENPDIAEQVLVYLATTFTHHTEGETMSTLYDKYGDGLTKEEFNRLLRQMAARGTIQLDSTRNYGRGRKGTIALLPDAVTKRELKQDPGYASQILNGQSPYLNNG